VAIEDQHVALPKLYGAPAYAYNKYVGADSGPNRAIVLANAAL